MPLGLWKKVRDHDWTANRSTGSSSATPRGSIESESELPSVTLRSNQTLAFCKTRFNSAWSIGRREEVKLSDFLQVKVLSNGSFGSIVLLKQYSSGSHYVLKVLPKDTVFKQRAIRKAEAERRILASINFPFLMNLKGQGQDSVNLYLVMEYLPGGDLWHLINRQKAAGRGFGEGDVRFYVSQVVLALEYLHYMGIVYRDLKPENIFLDAEGYLKLGDFGCSKRLGHSGRAVTQCGTRDYMPPEIVTGQVYTLAVDYWSLGVLIYELVTGDPPFFSQNKMDTYEKIVSGKFSTPRQASKEVKDLIQKLLVVDASRRLAYWPKGFDGVKGHEWWARSRFSWVDVMSKKSKPPFVPKLKHCGDTKYFREDPNNNPAGPANQCLFKQQLTLGFLDKFDKYFENF